MDVKRLDGKTVLITGKSTFGFISLAIRVASHCYMIDSKVNEC